MTPESEPGRRIAELERERGELQAAIKTMSEAHHAAFEAEKARADQLKAQLVEIERQRDNFRDQVKISDEAFNFHLKRANDEMERCNKLEVQLEQAQCKLAQLQQVAAQTVEEAKLRQEVAAQKLHIEHLESCLLNLNQERMEEAAKLQARLEAKDAVLEEQRKWCSSKRTEAPTPYHMNYNLVELRAELVKRDSQLTATHQKIQEWWSMLRQRQPLYLILTDMESFMRER